MKKLISAILLALPLLYSSATNAVDAHDGTILIVVSGEGRDQGKTRPGFKMDELSQAWLIFQDSGLKVALASPQGGPVEADGYNAAEPFNARFLGDIAAMAMLVNTQRIDALRAEDYDAVYIVGGKGAMFDLPSHTPLAAIIAKIYDGGGVVSAVCHGPAALANVRLTDGKALVAGRKLTGFSNEEEDIFGERWRKEFPFQLEDQMRANGANWLEAPLMMPNVVVDGRLITGQNPYSTTKVAEAVVRALGSEPPTRARHRDELSFDLIEQVYAGSSEKAARALAKQPSQYHVKLIGLVGYYQLKTAQSSKSVREALAVMLLAEPYFTEPQLKLGIAEGYLRLGQSAKARPLLEVLLEANPDLAEAKQLLAKLEG